VEHNVLFVDIYSNVVSGTISLNSQSLQESSHCKGLIAGLVCPSSVAFFRPL